MKNRVITISREFGSGGRTIGKAVAEQLGIPCYDNEILQEIARESGFEQSYIQETGEYAPGGFLAAAFSHPASGPSNADYLWEMQYKLIGQLAEKGPCVIVGRCADYVLAGYKPSIDIFLQANTEARTKTVMERENVSKKEAQTRIARMDKARATYYNYYTDRKWSDLNNYDIALNVSHLTAKEAADLLTAFINQVVEKTSLVEEEVQEEKATK